jgi:pSer/pThr/pTyr-binding forkhead associated (FHA) protein
MAKIVLTTPAGTSKEVQLDRERITVGRRAGNDLVLDDMAASGQHAVIITIMNDSFLEDMNSTNGTFVNGNRIKKHALRNSDQIVIGHHKLEYFGEQAGAEDDFEKTMIIRPEQLAKAGVDMPKPEAAPPPRAGDRLPLGHLQVIEGVNKGKELKLAKALNTIGQPGVQLAAITRRNNGYYIVHVGATSPDVKRATVNGEPVGTTARLLNNNDTVELLGIKMRFYLVAEG